MGVAHPVSCEHRCLFVCRRRPAVGIAGGDMLVGRGVMSPFGSQQRRLGTLLGTCGRLGIRGHTPGEFVPPDSQLVGSRAGQLPP
jgi:hypothetical protein